MQRVDLGPRHCVLRLFREQTSLKQPGNKKPMHWFIEFVSPESDTVSDFRYSDRTHSPLTTLVSSSAWQNTTRNTQNQWCQNKSRVTHREQWHREPALPLLLLPTPSPAWRGSRIIIDTLTNWDYFHPLLFWTFFPFPNSFQHGTELQVYKLFIIVRQIQQNGLVKPHCH